MSDPVTLDPLSYASFYVSQMYNGLLIGSGTCFFVKRDGKTFLLTNWHVVTAKDPITEVDLHPHHYHPDHLHIYVFKDQETVERAILDIKLYASDGRPLWKEHPSHSHKVDVVAIEIAFPMGMTVSYVEDCMEPFNEGTEVAIADDVFVLGYPFGLSVAEQFPIWKRASIASEPVIDAESLPLIYVDTASHYGMSGSPVVYRERRAVSIMGQNQFSRYRMSLVGIYSGRVGENKDFTVQLGRVWKAKVIDEIIGG